MNRAFRVWQALLLVGITLVPPTVVIWTSHPKSWVTAIELVPTLYAAIVLWWQFLYKISNSFRNSYSKIRARITSTSVRVTVFARYVVPDTASVDQVMGVIRSFYGDSAGEVKLAQLSGSGTKVVFMPGWQGYFNFLEPLEVEYMEPGDEVRRFSFTVPDANMNVPTALEHVKSRVIPLLSDLSNNLAFRLELVELKFLFEKVRNPYLSAFLIDPELQALRKLEYVSEEPNGSYVVHRDSVTITATNIGTFGYLAQKYLGLSYSLL